MDPSQLTLCSFLVEHRGNRSPLSVPGCMLYADSSQPPFVWIPPVLESYKRQSISGFGARYARGDGRGAWARAPKTPRPCSNGTVTLMIRLSCLTQTVLLVRVALPAEPPSNEPSTKATALPRIRTLRTTTTRTPSPYIVSYSDKYWYTHICTPAVRKKHVDSQ
ncbi:hypothetical protein BV22DRAFT_849479 [Leucogyrophana mollusca]|uniref:Uncharacterized protein n=1 Tax=Leucogyrophana mollusca TaxID=85980 RepID=A0ACB8B4J8_9AGAM|nr:hypothetical protein BV22DRAFT_849479 [Leucogyrophana mollusca]